MIIEIHSDLVYAEGKQLKKLDLNDPERKEILGNVQKEITQFTHDPLNKRYLIGTKDGPLYQLKDGEKYPRLKYILKSVLFDKLVNVIFG